MSDLDFNHHFNQAAKGDHRSAGHLHDIMVRRFKRHTTVDPVGDEKFRQMLFKKAGQEPAKEI